MKGGLGSKEGGWLPSKRERSPGGTSSGNGPSETALREGLAEVLSVMSSPPLRHPWQDKCRASQVTHWS